MTSKEALARLQADDVVGRSESSLRSSAQASSVSGKTQGGPPPLKRRSPPKPPAMPPMEVSAELLELSGVEDLEATPNLDSVNRASRPDTMPDWMLAPAVAGSTPTVPEPLPITRAPRSSMRTLGVALLGLVAAGTWWFAADGVKALNPAPAVVAAAPAVATPVSPVEHKAPVAEPVAQPTLTPAPVEAPVVKPAAGSSSKASAKVGSKKEAANKVRRSAKRRRAVKKPVALPPAKRGAVTSVSALVVGEAASGRGCRALGKIQASEHERVNACFKVKPAAGLSAVVVQWLHEGSVVRSTEHELSASKPLHAIRAFSRVQSGQSGKWTVQVRTPAGKVLASKRFTVGM